MVSIFLDYSVIFKRLLPVASPAQMELELYPEKSTCETEKSICREKTQSGLGVDLF